MLTDPLFWAVALPAVLIVAFGKGAFGGGLAVLGVPLMAMAMDPITAAIVVALLVVAMDMVALRSFGRASWSMPDLAWLIPGLVVGIGIGFATFTLVNPTWVGLIIGVVTLVFTADWFLRGRRALAGNRPVSPGLALLASVTGGFTTFVAHAGGPPVSLYLLARGLDKTLFAGTSIALFTLGNLIKLPPYIALGLARPDAFWAALALLPAVPVGVMAGRILHDRLPRERLYLVCYVLLGLASTKMVVDAVRALT
jgi:hypothetical protein